jgi:DNA-binding Xre family transcriptional regulator
MTIDRLGYAIYTLDMFNREGVSMPYIFTTHVKQLVLNKAAREGDTISQREVAAQTGLSLPTITNWFSGSVTRVEADTIGKLCAYLGCEMTDLITLQSSDAEG